MAQKLYSYRAVEDFYNERLAPLGYEWLQIREGTLGIGDVLFVSPDEQHYHFVVREVYLNEWSSAQTIRRTAKISKAIQREIKESECVLPWASRYVLSHSEL